MATRNVSCDARDHPRARRPPILHPLPLHPLLSSLSLYFFPGHIYLNGVTRRLTTWSLANRQIRPRSGENAATALENNLTTLEGKIDELLASFERSATALPTAGSTNGTGNGTSGAGAGGSSESTTNK